MGSGLCKWSCGNTEPAVCMRAYLTRSPGVAEGDCHKVLLMMLGLACAQACAGSTTDMEAHPLFSFLPYTVHASFAPIAAPYAPKACARVILGLVDNDTYRVWHVDRTLTAALGRVPAWYCWQDDAQARAWAGHVRWQRSGLWA